MPEDVSGDGILDIHLEEERDMPEPCDLPNHVFVGLLQESAAAHATIMNESRSNAVFQNAALRAVQTKKFDEVGPSESRSDTVARSPST